MSHPFVHNGKPLGQVNAILGPTNTGKTHHAIERMLRHDSGMLGLPLRLLAREIYDRCRSLRPDKHFALITGEEKIIPPHTDYYICTVESMPSDKEVAFLGVDEIQLCSDPERGHVFTDRLLNWRGRGETMFLGAETIKPLLKALLQNVSFKTRPRLSKLSYGGVKKISRLPRRSAIVAFNAENIYAIAELVRRQKGGAAVVMGSLSPRTRNAQVELFQSGDVPYIVATDAIGMGLNLELDHVAFSGTRKFDGLKLRELTAAEIGQIAGRAGRYMNDGTFGTTGSAQPFSDQLIEQIEDHQFDPLRTLYWRNANLDFSSLEHLADSLQKKPTLPHLHTPIGCMDMVALTELSKQSNIRKMAGTSAAVRKLWEVCQIPDYRNISPFEHINLISAIYTFLQQQREKIPEDWLSQEVSYADRPEGDIDTLANRLAHIRTWTFVSHRHDWLEDSQYWQDKTRAIEDKLSDALHQKLMARFIDRKTSLLMKRLRQKQDVKVSLMEDGKIAVENEIIGALKGFQFAHTHDGAAHEAKNLKSASSEIITAELKKRADSFLGADTISLTLGSKPHLLWDGEHIAQLKKGDGPLHIRAELVADELLGADVKEKINLKIQEWLDTHMQQVLEPLYELQKAEDVEGLAKGIAFQLIEARGILSRDSVADDVKALDQDARKQLRKYGVRFGAYHIYMPALLKPAPGRILLMLWALEHNIDSLPEQPPNGLTSLTADKNAPEGFYAALGYKLCGVRAARIDMLERLADMIRPVIFWKSETEGAERPEGSYAGGGFTVTPDMMSLLGCSGEEFNGVLEALGYKAQKKPAPIAPEKEAEASEETKMAAPEGDTSDQADGGTEPSEEASDQAMVDVWLPGKKKNPSPRKKRFAKKPRTNGKGGQKNSKAKSAKHPPIRPEDSPFAALLALKDAPEKTGSDK